jgi:hypothetical protein
MSSLPSSDTRELGPIWLYTASGKYFKLADLLKRKWPDDVVSWCHEGGAEWEDISTLPKEHKQPTRKRQGRRKSIRRSAADPYK